MSKKNLSKRGQPGHLFPSAAEDILHAKAEIEVGKSRAQLGSASFQLAFADEEFLLAEEQRGIRLMLELSKPDQLLHKKGIQHTVVMFGSARTPSPEHMPELEKTGALSAAQLLVKRQQARYYEEARKLAALITERSQWEE